MELRVHPSLSRLSDDILHQIALFAGGRATARLACLCVTWATRPEWLGLWGELIERDYGASITTVDGPPTSSLYGHFATARLVTFGADGSRGQVGCTNC